MQSAGMEMREMRINPLSFVRSVEKIAGEPPKSFLMALRVDSRSAGSIADVAGVEEGDYLLYVDEVPASEMDYAEMAIHCAEVRYTFYRPSESAYLYLKAAGSPLGVKFAKADETVLHEYTYGIDAVDHTDLYPIWNRRNWRMLQEITKKAFSPLLVWLNHLGDTADYCPEYLFNGAALYDSGNRSKGMRRILRFAEIHPESHTKEQSAVVIYYQGQQLLHSGDRTGAIEHLHAAFEHWPHHRITEELQELTGEGPVFKTHWPGQRFPCNYRLQRVVFGDGAWLQLSDELKAMESGQLFIICMLNGYRVNRFYNAFMQRYLGYLNSFPGLIHGLHVVTSEPWQENHPSYFEHEQRVLEEKGEINLLFDPDWELWNILEPHGSPAIFVLDKNGMVHHEGELLATDLWDVLSRFQRAPETDESSVGNC
jgi:hypothetical protein